MARFKEHDYSQGRFLSVFDSKYRNDETGAPAFDPAVLLKIILVA